MEILNDKYYTPVELSKRLIDKTYEIIGIENITEIIEPSAGSGSFSNQIDNCIAYDLVPESDNIIQADFLELELEYKKGRLFIGNPPFGVKNRLATSFYKKAVKKSDYVAFILPISQLNNSASLYDFDLIYSEDLTVLKYSNVNVHCCFNIYKRPPNGLLNLKLKKRFKLKDIEISEFRRTKNKTFIKNDYDFGICTYGSVGRFVASPEEYAKTIFIKVKNEELRVAILKLFQNCNWEKEFNFTKPPNLTITSLYEFLIKHFPELNIIS